MADIITGTVSGMVDTSNLVRDTADLRREVALETGDVRREVVKEGRHTSDVVNAASVVGQRDASSYYIAETAAATQNAKEVARSQAWTEAKIDANYQATTGQINLSTAINTGITQLEASKLQSSTALGHAALALQIANDGAATRSLMQHNQIDDLNRGMLERNALIVELQGDRRDCERNYNNLSHSMQQNQWASLQSQLQAFNSDLQTTKNSVTNFGSGVATGGATTSNIAR